jgi:hypothetical protein
MRNRTERILPKSPSQSNLIDFMLSARPAVSHSSGFKLLEVDGTGAAGSSPFDGSVHTGLCECNSREHSTAALQWFDGRTGRCAGA